MTGFRRRSRRRHFIFPQDIVPSRANLPPRLPSFQGRNTVQLVCQFVNTASVVSFFGQRCPPGDSFFVIEEDEYSGVSTVGSAAFYEFSYSLHAVIPTTPLRPLPA